MFLKSKTEKKSAQHRLSSMWQQNENKGRPANEGKTGRDRSVCFCHGCLTESWSHHRSHSFQLSVLSLSVSDGVCVWWVWLQVWENNVCRHYCAYHLKRRIFDQMMLQTTLPKPRQLWEWTASKHQSSTVPKSQWFDVWPHGKLYPSNDYK